MSWDADAYLDAAVTTQREALEATAVRAVRDLLDLMDAGALFVPLDATGTLVLVAGTRQAIASLLEGRP